MKKSLVTILVIVVIIVIGGGVYLATRGSSDTTNASKNHAMNMKQPETGNTSNKVATNSVSIENFAFSPANITVKKGTTVTWTNNDSTTHTVTENDGQTGPSSSDLAPGKSYSFTFGATGTFHYHCAIHPEMLGTVTVTE